MPSGNTEKTVNVEVCQEVYNYAGKVIVENCISIPVTIKNPCLDPNYVDIQCPASLTSLFYTVSSGLETYAAHQNC